MRLSLSGARKAFGALLGYRLVPGLIAAAVAVAVAFTVTGWFRRSAR